MIEQMRADFPLAAEWEDWSDDDQEAIGADIRSAIERNDAEGLAYWSWRLAEAAATWRAWCQRVRAVEARFRADKMARAG